MTRLNSKLCIGTVGHRRYRPCRHALEYRVFSILLDLDELDEAGKHLSLLSIDRPGIVSWWQKDHGLGNAAGLKHDIAGMVEQSGQEVPESVTMLTFPRMFGYAFNPLTVYFCRNGAGVLQTMVYEVANTFGGRHFYVIAAGEQLNGTYFHSARKAFFVSPFNNVEGDYAFRIAEDDKHLAVGVSLKINAQPLLTAHHVADVSALSDRNVLSAIASMPLMTFKVIAAIHLEALRLWMKGLRTTRRPTAPAIGSPHSRTQTGSEP